MSTNYKLFYNNTQTLFSFFILIFYECIVIFSKDTRYVMITTVWWLMTCACAFSCIKIFLVFTSNRIYINRYNLFEQKNLWGSQYFSVWRAIDDKKLRTFKLIFLQKNSYEVDVIIYDLQMAKLILERVVTLLWCGRTNVNTGVSDCDV